MNKIKQLKKSKNLTLLEVYNLLCDYNFKYEQAQKRISKKDFKEYTFLLWLKDKLLKKECKELLQADKKIGYCPKIPHKKTRCNNDKYEIYKRQRNNAPYYYDYFGLDVDYKKPPKKIKFLKQVKTKKYENNLKILPKKEVIKTNDNFYQDIKKECEPYIKTLLNNGYDLQYIDDYIKQHSFNVLSLTDFI